MYYIRWYDIEGHKVATGKMETITTLAYYLNKLEIYFKAGVTGTPDLPQERLNCGGMTFWLNPEDNWPEE